MRIVLGISPLEPRAAMFGATRVTAALFVFLTVLLYGTTTAVESSTNKSPNLETRQESSLGSEAGGHGHEAIQEASPQQHERKDEQPISSEDLSKSGEEDEPDDANREEKNGPDGEETPFSALPDMPLQLVRPDPLRHQRLELLPSNVQHLHYIDSAVAVVAVVGKFHSGKSFLLNQLMGKKDGFGIGPSVRPQTMGIWMWGKPMMMTLSSGEPLAVIFIDTEGFAANNISENYDAKIFSVATLLSSYLIYNSVKIIDQADIDYLELLARRTQLFALRSQMTKSQWFDQFNHDLLRFPPLQWIVQDFVQTTLDDETPQEWLHRIMDTSSREAGDYDINLLGIFESVDCRTLFLPATTKTLLQDLSKAVEEDLTEDYREERDELIAKLKASLKPKEKNGRPITGPGLATLLDILVTAANEGSLAEIPSRWEVFIDQLKVGSLEDCLRYYESEMTLLQHKHHHDAINETELQVWHDSAVMKSASLMKQLLFGLEAATDEAMIGLESGVAESFVRTKDINSKKVQLKCSEVRRRVEIEAEEILQLLVLPMKSVLLEKEFSGVVVKCTGMYRSDVAHLSGSPAFKREIEQLQSGLRHICDAVSLENRKAMEAVLQVAVSRAVVKFKEVCKNAHGIPRKTAVLRTAIQTATVEAEKVFETEGELANTESLYGVFEGHLKTKLGEQREQCERDNLVLVKEVCETQVIALISDFRLNTGPTRMVLPLNDSDLGLRLSEEKMAAIAAFSQTQANFQDTSAFTEVKASLLKRIAEVYAQRTEENIQAYIKEVKEPLEIAKDTILLSEQMYDTEFTLTQFMKRACMIQLDKGKARYWQKSLKLTIVDKFILDSAELQKLIALRRGWFSAIKGFFLWLKWLFSGNDHLIAH